MARPKTFKAIPEGPFVKAEILPRVCCERLVDFAGGQRRASGLKGLHALDFLRSFHFRTLAGMAVEQTAFLGIATDPLGLHRHMCLFTSGNPRVSNFLRMLNRATDRRRTAAVGKSGAFKCWGLEFWARDFFWRLSCAGGCGCRRAPRDQSPTACRSGRPYRRRRITDRNFEGIKRSLALVISLHCLPEPNQRDVGMLVGRINRSVALA